MVTLAASITATNLKLEDLIITLKDQAKTVSANRKYIIGTFLASITTATSIVSIIFLFIK